MTDKTSLPGAADLPKGDAHMDPFGDIAFTDGRQFYYGDLYTPDAVRAILSAPAVEPVAVMEALKWCAAALQGLVLTRQLQGDILMTMEGQSKTIDQILDIADDALAPPASPAEQAATQAEAKKGTFNCPVCGKDTPHHHSGVWTLTAPDGRQWHGDSPIKACREEQRSRIPDEVAVERVMQEADSGRADGKHWLDGFAGAKVEQTEPVYAAPTAPTGAQAEPTHEAIEDFLAARVTNEGRVPMVKTIREALSHFAPAEQAAPKADSAPPLVAWEYENAHGNRFLTHSDPHKWHEHDQAGFKNFRALTYIAAINAQGEGKP